MLTWRKNPLLSQSLTTQAAPVTTRVHEVEPSLGQSVNVSVFALGARTVVALGLKFGTEGGGVHPGKVIANIQGGHLHPQGRD